jgi:hypothetical protein
MLREMRALFGSNMWDNVLVCVSKWSYEASEVDKRNKTCIMSPGANVIKLLFVTDPEYLSLASLFCLG